MNRLDIKWQFMSTLTFNERNLNHKLKIHQQTFIGITCPVHMYSKVFICL